MLARHPEVVKKAQTDIDQVTGRERLPMLIDRKNIPYIDCIMKEVFRCALTPGLSMLHSDASS